MRIGGTEALTWADIDRQSGSIYVATTKTGKARKIPLDLSDRLFHDREGKQFHRDKINGMLEFAMRQAGVP